MAEREVPQSVRDVQEAETKANEVFGIIQVGVALLSIAEAHISFKDPKDQAVVLLAGLGAVAVLGAFQGFYNHRREQQARTEENPKT